MCMCMYVYIYIYVIVTTGSIAIRAPLRAAPLRHGPLGAEPHPEPAALLAREQLPVPAHS